MLDTVNTVLNRAANFFWKGLSATVKLLDGIYEKGVKVVGKKKVALEKRLQRSLTLPWWDITIHPKTV